VRFGYDAHGDARKPAMIMHSEDTMAKEATIILPGNTVPE
jgi:hypothetical protein